MKNSNRKNLEITSIINATVFNAITYYLMEVVYHEHGENTLNKN